MTQSINNQEFDSVLIVTGSLLSPKESSLSLALKKQWKQLKQAENHWLEIKIKSLFAESFIPLNREREKILKQGPDHPLYSFFSTSLNLEIPDLTEVTLMSLLEKEGLEFQVCQLDEVFAGTPRAQKLLNQSTIVFLSTTLLKDLSELEAVVHQIHRPHHKLVIGGALAGNLCHTWQGMENVDILAIGYGEYLIPTLGEWIRSGYQNLTPPPSGRIEKRQHTWFLYSGVPEQQSLDFIERPNWSLAQNVYKKNFPMIYYESVRGCPYRCAFCNYPYLFADSKFRYKSAQKMAADWKAYEDELGIEYITCLDSLFTMPKKRLIEFCQLLISQNSKIKWICYARADDLCDEEVVKLLKEAGACQVQIGIESGDTDILKNMNKKVTVAKNLKAIENCRKYGITSLITLIVGFPGETSKTLENTYQFMKTAQPDFHFLAVFSTRVAGVPVLSEESRKTYDLITSQGQHTVSPYWKHKTMDCLEATKFARELNSKIIDERLSLEGTLLYRSILNYTPHLKTDLLDFQKRAWKEAKWTKRAFHGLNYWIDRQMKRELQAMQKSAKVLAL